MGGGGGTRSSLASYKDNCFPALHACNQDSQKAEEEPGNEARLHIRVSMVHICRRKPCAKQNIVL